MGLNHNELINELNARFGAGILGMVEFRGQQTLRISRDVNVAVLKVLRDDPKTKFNMLTDVTCVDSLRLPSDMQDEYPERFAVVYQLTSIETGARLRVKAYVPEDPCEIETASSLWLSANWGEREAFDMYGVVFTGHPDLKRILMPDNYEGHPLRKDYPLKGRGERDNFPKFVRAF